MVKKTKSKIPSPKETGIKIPPPGEWEEQMEEEKAEKVADIIMAPLVVGTMILVIIALIWLFVDIIKEIVGK